MNRAHVTASRAFFLIQWHDTSHRFIVCRPTVRRSSLQAATSSKSWTEIQNNRYSTRKNACNNLVQLNILAWLHKTSLLGHPEAILGLLETYQQSLGA
jgi:hypothetical protein